MPWKQNYTSSDEIAVKDEAIQWPNSAACYFGVVIDLSLPCDGDGIKPKAIRNDQALFQLNEGLNQLLTTLDDFKLKATFAVPGIQASALSKELQEITKLGHEVAAHGFKHEDLTQLEKDAELERLLLTTDLLGEACGERPLGWFSLPRSSDKFAVNTLSPNTVELLNEHGYLYLGNGLADDAPYYWVADFERSTHILTLPYYYHFDDQFFMMFPQRGTGLEHADGLARNWEYEFAAQQRRGRYFHMVLHPRCSGFGHRLRMLRAFFAQVREQGNIWNASNKKVAEYWQKTHPAETALKLEPSIWQDYEGSLS